LRFPFQSQSSPEESVVVLSKIFFLFLCAEKKSLKTLNKEKTGQTDTTDDGPNFLSLFLLRFTNPHT